MSGDGNKKSISISGWHVHSTKSNSIMGQNEISHRSEETVRTKHVPEMVFNSELRLKHAQSEVEFTFNATEALKEWMLAKNEVIKVKNSERWMQLHLERYGGKKTEEEEENKGRREGKERRDTKREDDDGVRYRRVSKRGKQLRLDVHDAVSRDDDGARRGHRRRRRRRRRSEQ